MPLPSSPLRSRRPLREGRRSGFALLITVTLLAFLVLLLVTLATLTRVETQVAGNSQQLSKARQNALLALNIALGQLQRSAGPDQRTTAPAALGEGATGITAAQTGANGLGAVTDGTRYWTGVWGNQAAPDAIFTGAPKPVLLQWLVSGNEATPAFATAGDGHVTSPATAAATPFNPAQPVTRADGSDLSAAVTATTALLINGKPAALLLGPNAAGDNVGSYVAAPLVTIDSGAVPGVAGPAPVGRIAWWVGDEGVKAKYNLPDPYIGKSTPDAGTTADSRDSRYRLLAAQRNGIERMNDDGADTAGFGDSNYPVATTAATSPVYLATGKAITLPGVRLAAPSISPASLQKHVHDLTTCSYGVLSDSQFGGLRRDLTFHLDAQSGDTFLDGRDILPDGATPVADYSGADYTAKPSLFSDTTANGGLGYAGLDVSPRLGPKWDQLKSFYQMAYDHPADLEVQPAVDLDVSPVKVQEAITPVILETRMLFAVQSGPKIGTAIVLILGNPYSRPLKASQGLDLRITEHPFRYDTSWWGEELGLICNYVSPVVAGKQTISSVFTRRQGNRSKNHSALRSAPPLTGDYAAGEYFHSYYPILKFRAPPGAKAPADPDDGHPGALDDVLFQIPPGVLDLAPGEAKAYRIKEGATLPAETVDGVSMRVIPLEEMGDSLPTYFTQVCDARYVSDSSVFSESDYASGGSFQGCLNITSDRGAWGTSLDFTLTLPGKPQSIVQQLSAGNTNTNTLGSTGVPAHTFSQMIFGTDPFPVSGIIYKRDFGPSSFSTDAVVAVYAGRNLTGGIRNSLLYNAPANSNPYPSFAGSSIMALDSFVSTETQFTAGLDPANATQAAWGQGETGAPFRVSPAGRSILRDAPAAYTPDETPVFSLGQLQHADLTADDEVLGTGLQAGNAVGNSWYSFTVPRALSFTAPMGNWHALRYSNFGASGEPGDSPRYLGYVPDLPKTDQIRSYDISYLLNAALWDSFFFSTVRPAAGSDSAAAPLPANRRLVYAGPAPTLGQLRASDASGLFPDPSALTAGENGRAPAAWMLTDGAFNVNSTSTEAWVAVLSGLRGLAANTAATAAADVTPFARSIRQAGDAQTVLAGGVEGNEATYDGYRALTDAQVSTLAAAIVAQVRARGPFLSLSQFVNRRLTPAEDFGDAVGDTGLSGALQRAIDGTDSNKALLAAARLKPGKSPIDMVYPENAQMPTGDTSGLGYYQGAPGWLTQADVLESLAPALSARSDTFVIRTCGEVLDPLNSPAAPAAPVVLARAWCEAVVQRVPGYVDDSVRATVNPANAGATNQAFGRRFRIISFRWLSPDDI